MSGFWQIVDQVMRLDLSGFNEISLPTIFLIIVVTSFFTEDGACLAAGALVGQGTIGFSFALAAAATGIFIGDIGLYWVGRIFGKSIADKKLFKRFISERNLRSASLWLEKRGMAAIFISRFVAGLRLPTYFVAGFVKTNFIKFTFYFAVAVAIWTPLIVGSAAFAQKIISPNYILLTIIALFLLFKFISNLVTWKRRRFFIGKLKRIKNWEFWPLSIFYFPVFIYVITLALRHRSLTVFTCANPVIPAGGFIGESKDQIYNSLKSSQDSEEYLLKHKKISRNLPFDERISCAEEFLRENQLGFPIVLKPDAGERGKEVLIAHDKKGLLRYAADFEEDFIVQQYFDGVETGIFYFRYPSRGRGRIFSITEKSFPEVVGDGESNLEKLILSDGRAVCLAEKYLEYNFDALQRVPEQGERVKIIDIGTHSRGAIFSEGDHLHTEELELKIDEISRRYKGFYFGRFDIRAVSFESLKRGEEFKIIEINGVTSESTNIYDKRYNLLDAYRILFRQWKIAFEIGRENQELGAKPTPIKDLVRMLFGFHTEIDDKNPDAVAEICV
ncbi:MAG: hypothetical protein HKN25_12370 [Pyrinomonadaceae bacterium]|nr:hypothetical protein [Pyrinomonadaceae bacterium]